MRRGFRMGRRGGRRGGFRWLPIVLMIGYGAYYYFSNQQINPETGRKQLVDMSVEQEMKLGLASYQQILQKERISQDPRLQAQIRSIGEKLSRVVKDDPGYEWDYTVIESNQANAFCLPGGKVAVYTGLLPVAENEHGLAVVMGHEIAHAMAHHGAERMAHQKLAQVGQMAVSVAAGGMDSGSQQMVMSAFGLGAQYGALLPFSRKHESEADYMGLLYVARACYDPREAPLLWERMGKASGGQPSEFQSTHPSHETRISNFQKWMPEAIKIYNEKCPNKI